MGTESLRFAHSLSSLLSPSLVKRGVLAGWRSSVASQSMDQGCATSPSQSCERMTPGTPVREVPDSPTQLEREQDVLALDDGTVDSEEKMRMTPSPAPEAYPVVKPGFLHHPTAIAFDPIQKIIAIGNRSGFIRLIGFKRDAEIDSHFRQPNGAPVIQLAFVFNEGLVISMGGDDTIHLWNIKLKLPEVLNSLKFNRERLTVSYLPFQSKWMYIGTEKGNTHVANVESLTLSGYVINWNKAIDLAQKTHPGAVVHLSDCPVDPNKLLIGFDSGLIVFWDLRNRSADTRFSYHVVSSSSSFLLGLPVFSSLHFNPKTQFRSLRVSFVFLLHTQHQTVRKVCVSLTFLSSCSCRHTTQSSSSF